MLCGLCLGGRVKLRRWLSDWEEDRLDVRDGVANRDLLVVFEVRCRDIWRSPYGTDLRVAVDDDQQVATAGRKLLEGLPLTFRSLAFGYHLTRNHVMPSRPERSKDRNLAFNTSIQRLRRHDQGQECEPSGFVP